MLTDFWPPVANWAPAKGVGSCISGKTNLIRSPTQTCAIGPMKISLTKPEFSVGREFGRHGPVVPKTQGILCGGLQQTALT